MLLITCACLSHSHLLIPYLAPLINPHHIYTHTYIFCNSIYYIRNKLMYTNLQKKKKKKSYKKYIALLIYIAASWVWDLK